MMPVIDTPKRTALLVLSVLLIISTASATVDWAAIKNGTYNITTFTYSGTGVNTSSWVVPAGVTTAEVLVVGGGGGGGGHYFSGGGGAGGIVYCASYPVTAGTTYNILVGLAGAGGLSTGGPGDLGGNTSFGPAVGAMVAWGGGGGGYFDSLGDTEGGSGGGGSSNAGTGSNGVQTDVGGGFGYGNDGGDGSGYTGGGGGGAAGDGADGPAGSPGTTPTLGGKGMVFYTSQYAVYYSTGGIGVAATTTGSGAAGVNPGDGGAGGGSGLAGGYGASGTVIIKYLTPPGNSYIQPSGEVIHIHNTTNTAASPRGFSVDIQSIPLSCWTYIKYNFNGSLFNVTGLTTNTSIIPSATLSSYRIINSTAPLWASSTIEANISFSEQQVSAKTPILDIAFFYHCATAQRPPVNGEFFYNVSHFGNDTSLTEYSNGISGIWRGYQSPNALFENATAYPREGAAPLTVVFLDNSTVNWTPGDLTWSWSFDDADPATTQNPSHNFNFPGNFSVTLMVSNGNYTSTLTRTDYVVITVPAQVLSPYYPQHQVRLLLKDRFGRALKYVNVIADPLDRTVPAEWMPGLFGLNTTLYIDTYNLSGVSGTDGSWVTYLFESQRYQIWFINATQGIRQYVDIYPKEDEYVINLETTASALPENREDYINCTLTAVVNGSYTDLRLNYVDTSGATTTNITYWVKDDSGSIVYWKSFPNFGSSLLNQTANWSLSVPTTTGTRYYWGVNATSEDWATYYRSVGVTLRAVGGRLIDLGFDAMFGTGAANLYYTWISLGLIFVLAGIFSAMTIKFGVVTVPLMAGFFWWIGWYSGQLLAITIPVAIFLGVLLHLRRREREVFG